MSRKDRAALWGRAGPILVSLALMGGLVAEPLLRPLWSPPLAIAQR
ncbi:hypothetical protein [Microvirga zambiensis]|nr:hypothetical protein [Microvirga zambiensis]